MPVQQPTTGRRKDRVGVGKFSVARRRKCLLCRTQSNDCYCVKGLFWV